MKASSARKKMLLQHKGHYWFLFNDVLVFCSKKKILGEGKLFDHIETTYLTDFKSVVPIEEKKFQIHFHSKQIWQLSAHSTKDRDQWVYIIQTLMKEHLFTAHRATVLNMVEFGSKPQEKAQQVSDPHTASTHPTEPQIDPTTDADPKH